jgi:RNA polymerase sigma-70 factor (ECF subfamily)
MIAGTNSLSPESRERQAEQPAGPQNDAKSGNDLPLLGQQPPEHAAGPKDDSGRSSPTESLGVTVPDSPEDLVKEQVVRLYKENGGGLLRYASAFVEGKETAQDALQEVFLRFFVLRMGGLRIHNPRAWLYRVLRNYLLDRKKEFATRRRVNLDEVVELPDWRQDPETNHRQTEQVQRFLKKLTPRELECIQLRSDGFDYKEIAGILDIRLGTVGALLARALKKLRDLEKM